MLREWLCEERRCQSSHKTYRRKEHHSGIFYSRRVSVPFRRDTLRGDTHYYRWNARGGNGEYRRIQTVCGGKVTHARTAEQICQRYLEQRTYDFGYRH